MPQVSATVDDSIERWIIDKADKEKRSISNMVEVILSRSKQLEESLALLSKKKKSASTPKLK